MKIKKLAALFTALAMTFAAAGCSSSGDSAATEPTESPAASAETGDQSEQTEQPADKSADEPAEKTIATDTAAGTSSSETVIMRKKRADEKPMGSDDTWTILIYLCGSDLESGAGAATLDIAEMIESSANENVRFVIQTGGASKWQNELINAGAAERYVVQNGDIELVDKGSEVNMGDSSSLADFLHWGIGEYPASNMGLIFWDHGSGSINGVCFDENHGDALGLKEIDAALYSVFDEMTEPFEFIGFDACLMSTAETAAIMATHAKYLVASEEVEPGSGWNYTQIGNFMAENPACTGAELGKVIVDSFYDDCAKNGLESGVTLSVIDLTKFDKFIEAFGAYSQDIYELTENGSDFSGVARKINEADNFGGNTKSSGYTNMVDIGGIISAGKDMSQNAEAALKALEDTVVYKKNGSSHSGASGLSVYYPLCVTGGSQELGLFKDVALSSYYLGLVDKIAYGAVNGSIGDYDNSDVVGLFSNNWSSDDYSESGGVLQYIMDVTSQWDFVDDYTPGSGETTVSYDVEPGFDDDGFYSFTLSQDCIDEIDHIEGGVFMYSEEDLFAIELGESGEVYGDFETGEFVDGFSKLWFALPDGQLIAAYLEENCDGYDLYTSPILLNGEETNLRFAYYYGDDADDPGEVEIIDAWDGIDENGVAARAGRELKKGDIITPRYYLINLDADRDMEDTFFEGDEYKYDGKGKISFTELCDGDYLYCFYICDIYGNYETTDYVKFTINGDDIDYDFY